MENDSEIMIFQGICDMLRCRQRPLDGSVASTTQEK